MFLLWMQIKLFTAGYMTQYRWIIPVKSGPGVSDPNCIAFAYRSAVDFVKVKLSIT